MKYLYIAKVTIKYNWGTSVIIVPIKASNGIKAYEALNQYMRNAYPEIIYEAEIVGEINGE